MVRVLGVQCTAQFAFLMAVQEGQIVELGPARLAPAQCTDKDKALWETLGTFGMALDEISPGCVHLPPGTGDKAKQTHQEMTPRIELETLLRMVAAKRGA